MVLEAGEEDMIRLRELGASGNLMESKSRRIGPKRCSEQVDTF